MNSPVKPLVVGSPTEASVNTMKKTPNMGIWRASPPYADSSRVCPRSYTMPTSRKSPAATSPWLTIWITAPWMPARSRLSRPSITYPR